MMVADGESQLFAERQSLLKAEILELMKEDASVVFVEPKTPDWTLESATPPSRGASPIARST